VADFSCPQAAMMSSPRGVRMVRCVDKKGQVDYTNLITAQREFAEMEIEVRFIDPDQPDVYARQLIRDVGATAGIGDVVLGTTHGKGGEKGIVEDLGIVVVTVINAIGVDNLLDAIKGLLPARRPLSTDARKIVLKLPDGTQVELEGAMSDADFQAASRRVMRIVEKAPKDAAT
jgi:hypothetical protein